MHGVNDEDQTRNREKHCTWKCRQENWYFFLGNCSFLVGTIRTKTSIFSSFITVYNLWTLNGAMYKHKNIIPFTVTEQTSSSIYVGGYKGIVLLQKITKVSVWWCLSCDELDGIWRNSDRHSWPKSTIKIEPALYQLEYVQPLEYVTMKEKF